jgi:hypothetical protein
VSEACRIDARSSYHGFTPNFPGPYENILSFRVDAGVRQHSSFSFIRTTRGLFSGRSGAFGLPMPILDCCRRNRGGVGVCASVSCPDGWEDTAFVRAGLRFRPPAAGTQFFSPGVVDSLPNFECFPFESSAGGEIPADYLGGVAGRTIDNSQL